MSESIENTINTLPISRENFTRKRDEISYSFWAFPLSIKYKLPYVTERLEKAMRIDAFRFVNFNIRILLKEAYKNVNK